LESLSTRSEVISIDYVSFRIASKRDGRGLTSVILFKSKCLCSLRLFLM